MAQAMFSIGKAARRTGLSVHTLRYYDKEGLLPFVERTDSGLRRFKEDDFHWLNLINCLKSTGMSIKQIKEYIDLCMEGESTVPRRLEIFRQQKALVEERMKELQGFMETLDYKIGIYTDILDQQD